MTIGMVVALSIGFLLGVFLALSMVLFGMTRIVRRAETLRRILDTKPDPPTQYATDAMKLYRESGIEERSKDA